MCAACAYTTDRLTVGPWPALAAEGNGADLASTVAAILTPAVTASLPDEWQGPFGPERARRWIEQRDGEGATLLARDRRSGQAIGLLVLHEIADATAAVVDVRLGYLVAESAWGQGYGRELVAGFVGWCRGQPAIRSLAGGVEAGNVASIRILEACGFVPEPGAADGDSLVYRLDLAT